MFKMRRYCTVLRKSVKKSFQTELFLVIVTPPSKQKNVSSAKEGGGGGGIWLWWLQEGSGRVEDDGSVEEWERLEEGRKGGCFF